jgi:hypothetical protein
VLRLLQAILQHVRIITRVLMSVCIDDNEMSKQRPRVELLRAPAERLSELRENARVL